MSLSTLTTLPDTETPFFVDGPEGKLEASFLQAKEPTNRVAVLCHPHPLHEGTMHNKVVHALSRAFRNKNIHSIRFNYRGVGESEGSFGDSVGEIEDAIAVANWLESQIPNAQFYFAGFSFGAYIAAGSAAQVPCQQLFSIAPAVHHQPYDKLPPIHCPWVVVQGEEDEIIPPEKVYAWFDKACVKPDANMQLIRLPQASHFFHAKLIDLRNVVTENIV